MNRRKAIGGLFALPFIFKGLMKAKPVVPVKQWPVGLWVQLPNKNMLPYTSYSIGIENFSVFVGETVENGMTEYEYAQRIDTVLDKEYERLHDKQYGHKANRPAYRTLPPELAGSTSRSPGRI